MKIFIYGAGAVGLGLASFLIKAGATVHILARERTAAALQRGGLQREGIFGRIQCEADSFRSYSLLNEIETTPYDFILVCVKSFDTKEAAKDIFIHKKMMSPWTRIVHYQNGWGNAENFLDYFPKDQIYSARVITGFKRLELNQVNITVHAQPVSMGSLFGEDIACLAPLAEYMVKGGMPCELTDHIGKELWAKMLYNCALNPLGAILRVSYGRLGEHKYTREMMNRIFEEIYRLFEVTEYQTHWPTAESYQDIFYSKLLPSTYHHESSMLQDIRQGKRTEIDVMNGAVIQLAKTHAIDMPYNESVYSMLKFIEKESAKHDIQND